MRKIKIEHQQKGFPYYIKVVAVIYLSTSFPIHELWGMLFKL